MPDDRPRPVAVPAGYDAGAFPSFAVTVDIVILTIRDGRLQVLLVERGGEPYLGWWALPGGFKRPDETLAEAAARELLEETGITAPAHLDQFRTYGDPGRDPRTNVVSVGHLAVVPDLPTPEAGTDARDAQLFDIETVFARQSDGSHPLEVAFDHRQMVFDAVAVARQQLELTDLALSFVGPTFAIADLRRVHEAIWGAPLDPANFRRSLGDDGTYVVPTGDIRPAGPAGGRPAELFRATTAWSSGSPVRLRRKRTS